MNQTAYLQFKTIKPKVGTKRDKWQVCSAGISMEKMFKVKALLNFSPTKLHQKVENARAKVSRMSHMAVIEGFSAMADHTKSNSLTPRKNRLSPGRLFHNAKHIAPSDTYLSDKIHKISPTNESSSPRLSEDRQGRLLKPQICTNNQRSVSGAGRDGERREIQRTVQIMIGGRGGLKTKQDVMSALSKIILGQAPSDDLVMEWLSESSIRKEEENFLELDSVILEDLLKLDGQEAVEV